MVNIDLSKMGLDDLQNLKQAIKEREKVIKKEGDSELGERIMNEVRLNQVVSYRVGSQKVEGKVIGIDQRGVTVDAGGKRKRKIPYGKIREIVR